MYIKKGNRREAIGKRLEKRDSLTKSSFFFFLVSFFCTISSNAQCAMCRAALETEEGGVKGEAVNDGILYLMVIPYLLVGILGFAIYRMYFKKKKSE
ncbi:hypothetical protein [uncultured Flavobacterium sp.]|uniref:hypothetical protein n=1 Tax=uncultured Flavobacterium sp. TaxID=165435 RepID=UPI0025E69750|nr:hypothetical protein [uncultured Flavobacterium sp.]